MRTGILQTITWATIAAAIASAAWLASYAPQKPFGAARDSSVEALVDASLDIPTQAGPAASPPAASASAERASF